MFPRSGIINFGWLLFVVLQTPADAHKVETAQDVGATVHIEPNDHPRAGESHLTWFALVGKGGQTISLSQCNCKLAVRATDQKGSLPLLEPRLKAISAEGYQGIPAADIMFPQAGGYELELSGSPQAGANFKPFELSYEITVAPGTATKPNTSPVTQLTPSQRSQAQSKLPAIAVSTFVGLGLILAVCRQRTKHR